MAGDIVLNPDGTIKKDVYDVGAPMRPAVPGVAYEYPENVYSDAPKRGNYEGRIQPRVHWRHGRYNVWGEYEPDGRGEARHG